VSVVHIYEAGQAANDTGAAHSLLHYWLFTTRWAPDGTRRWRLRNRCKHVGSPVHVDL